MSSLDSGCADDMPCPVCSNQQTQPFTVIPQIPIYCNVLWDTCAKAKAAARGDMQLTYCDRCGHIYNQCFDESRMDYNQSYENSLHHSPRFQQYATDLVSEFIQRYQVRNKNIIEIGAGQGDFLQMMCVAGNNNGTGFDPSYVPKSDLPDYLNFVAEYYSQAHADYPADVILCRHVLEHIKASGEFVAMIRRIIGCRSHIVCLFEVPNALWTLRQKGIWDIIYEHCGYFSPSSLAYVFSNNSFQVNRSDIVFGGQFLTIEVTPSPAPTPLPPEFDSIKAQLARDVTGFATVYENKVAQWQHRFAKMRENRQQAVIWGTGSKGVMFLNILNPNGVIDYAVDINPRKQGMFVAGMGQQIVDPAFLKSYQPDTVIIMNKNYREEITQTLRELDVSAKVMVA